MTLGADEDFTRGSDSLLKTSVMIGAVHMSGFLHVCGPPRERLTDLHITLRGENWMSPRVKRRNRIFFFANKRVFEVFKDDVKKFYETNKRTKSNRTYLSCK